MRRTKKQRERKIVFVSRVFVFLWVFLFFFFLNSLVRVKVFNYNFIIISFIFGNTNIEKIIRKGRIFYVYRIVKPTIYIVHIRRSNNGTF